MSESPVPLTPAAGDPVGSLRAVSAERNRLAARWLRSVHDAARVGVGGARRDSSDRFSADEIAPVLGCSPQVAGRWVELADDLVGRLPAVLAAMAAGGLDEAKARALSEWTRDLQRDHARHVCDAALPHAAGLPTGMLIERIQELAVAVDPEWAARREARARRRARVVGSTTPDGTASLAGYDLPVDGAVLALARVEALADRLRAAGVDRPVQALRAAVYLRLLDGVGEGLDDAAFVDLLAAELGDAPPPPPEPGPHDPPPGPDDGPDDSGPDDSGGPGGDLLDPDDGDGSGAGDGGGDGAGGPGVDPGDPAAPPEDAPAPRVRGLRRGTTELRVRWSTLLGLDDLPGRIPRWGPVLAATARRWVADHPHAEWRIVLTTDSGHLRHVLLTRHRPRAHPPPRAGADHRPRAVGRDVVELQVPMSALRDLVPLRHPSWAATIAAAQRRLADLPADGSPDARPAARDAATRRRAHSELDRWVRTRDRRCAFPTCPRPATGCDLDHTRSWAADGPSAAANLGALCRRHHRLKHLADWTLTQPRPGHFHWRTRGGHHHVVPARPVIDPLPAPTPARRRRSLGPDRAVPHPGDGLRPLPGTRPPRPCPRVQDAPRRPQPVPAVYPEEPPF